MAATVGELSEPYAAFMRNPLAPDSPGICEVCLCFTAGRYPTCYPCGHRSRHADAVLGVVVIGRLIDQTYEDQGERLEALPRPFDWDICALHSGAVG